jgi:hypothetical protein
MEKKCVDNEGEFVDKQFQLCKGCTCDVCKIHYNCNNSFKKYYSHTDIRNVLPLHRMLQSQEISTRNAVMIKQGTAADHTCGTD